MCVCACPCVLFLGNPSLSVHSALAFSLSFPQVTQKAVATAPPAGHEGHRQAKASLVNPSSQGRPLAMLWLSQGLKLWQRVRLGNQPQCLIGGMALETDLHVCHNASGVLYNA